jgi:hypothetical protein
MKNFITKQEMEIGKTYNKLVSVVVKRNDGNRYYEFLPAKKSEMLDVIYRFNLKSEINSIEVVKEYYTLKTKWL